MTSVADINVLPEQCATHGLQDSVVSDNGMQFTSEEFRKYLASNLIRQILVAPYHPASNGLAERAVQTTKNALKRIISGSWQN